MSVVLSPADLNGRLDILLFLWVATTFELLSTTLNRRSNTMPETLLKTSISGCFVIIK